MGNTKIFSRFLSPVCSAPLPVFKGLQLDFLGVYLQQLTTAHTLFSNEGRAFSFELGNGLLTGASHGHIYVLEANGLKMRRFSPVMSPDPIISAAGDALVDLLRDNAGLISTYKFHFSAFTKSFLCIAKPVVDPYGLAWMACVVLSLTDLFRPMNKAALRMVGWTTLAVVMLSLFAGFLISWLVVRSLHQLSDEMGDVAEMNLDAVFDGLHHPSVFYEISTMQTYFYKMVQNLKEYRAFLPSAILNTPRPAFNVLPETRERSISLVARLYTPQAPVMAPSSQPPADPSRQSIDRLEGNLPPARRRRHASAD